MKRYKLVTFTLIALALVAAIPAEANERGLFNERKENRQELKARFTEKRIEIFSKKTGNIFRAIDRTISRLENASNRIDSRITKIEDQTEKDLTDAKNKLKEAKDKITETKTKVESKKTELKNLLESESEIKFDDIKNHVKEIRDEIKLIKNLLVETVKLIK